MTTRRFLLACHDAGGTVPPMLALAQEMLAGGHEVVFLSQPSVTERALVAGCSFFAFDGIGNYEPGRSIEEQIDLAMTVITGAQIGNQVTALAETARADAVVLDCNLAGAAAAAECLSVPSALVLHSMYKTFTEVWFAELWPFMGPAINNTRASYGLEAAGSWTEVFAGHDRLISVVPRTFDAPTTAVPKSMRHWGFLLPHPPPGHAPTFPDGEGPKVLVSLSSTYQHQEQLLQTILDALADRPLRGLVTTCGQVNPDGLEVPSNVEVHEYLPHGLVLPDTDVLVTHAGLGTVSAGLGHGVPMVCVPIGRDQPLNAERVAARGAGIALGSGPTPGAIRQALEEVLSTAEYRDAARAISAASTEAGGPAAAVDDLDALCA